MKVGFVVKHHKVIGKTKISIIQFVLFFSPLHQEKECSTFLYSQKLLEPFKDFLTDITAF